MDDFERELKLGFLEEAKQLLDDAEQSFLSLEHSYGDTALIDKIFRLAHNLKGSAKAVGFDGMAAFAHTFESLLLKIKNKELNVDPNVVSLLLRCNDHLCEMVDGLKGDFNATFDSGALVGEMQDCISGRLTPASSVPAPVVEALEAVAEAPVTEPVDPEVPEESIHVPSRDQFEGEATFVQPVEVVAPAPVAVAAQSSDETIRVSLSRLEKLLNFVGEMVILQTVLQEQVHGSNPILLKRTVHQLGKVTKEVQDISMSLRMIPLKQTFQKMQRIVRDTAGALGKKVQLLTTGDETEVDKTVLENINDPLVHIIRNAVDHGIESAEKRRSADKPESGSVTLSAFHQGGSLIIEVRDDGGGINPDVLRKKALEKGILRAGQQISDREAINLIFHPGFSTKQEVTEVSGRGVGMDVVKTNIERLQGEVTVDTVIGKGSVFHIKLPLTLAIIDGMIVKSEGERYVIPLNHVSESFRPSEQDVHLVTRLGEVLKLRGENLPLYRLPTLLGKKAEAKKLEDSIAVVVRSDGNSFAVLVDDIVGQQQVVIKKLGIEISNLRGFSGSAILGDGRPALILELAELTVKSPTKASTNSSNELRRAV